MPDYVIATTVSGDFDSTLDRTKEALAENGFGILSEIPVHETFARKLDVDFRRYVILGACHAPSAHRALTEEESIGVLLPCNVVVFAGKGVTHVQAVRPTQSLSVTGREDLAPLGQEVEHLLAGVIEAL
ncbi:MAG: DUF302 domain-containing protein [Planctomycetota bacterium]